MINHKNTIYTASSFKIKWLNELKYFYPINWGYGQVINQVMEIHYK